MHVSDILTRNVETIQPDVPVKEAARKMRSLDVGSLPVCDGSRLLGMITDRDIAVRIVAEGRDDNTRVAEAMSAGVAFCFDDDDVRRAADLMEQYQVRRLPVLDHNKQLVGILSLGDLAITGKDKLSGEALERISQPSSGARAH